MADIILVTLPVFALLALGYLTTFWPVFDASTGKVLAAFVYWLAIPALLVRALSRIELPATLPTGQLLAYLGGVAVTFGLSIAIARARGERDVVKLGILGFSGSFGNTLLLGTPIVLTAFGEQAVLPFFLVMTFDSLFLFAAVTAVCELGRGGSVGLRNLPRAIVERLLTNPVMVAMLVGIAMNMGGIGLPRGVDRFVDLLSGAAVPCALVATGAALRNYRIEGSRLDAVVLTSLKLLLQPLLVWTLATYVFVVPAIWTAVATVAAGMPVGVNAYIFANRYDRGQAATAAAILLSTLVSVLTVTTLIALLVPPPA